MGHFGIPGKLSNSYFLHGPRELNETHLYSRTQSLRSKIKTWFVSNKQIVQCGLPQQREEMSFSLLRLRGGCWDKGHDQWQLAGHPCPFLMKQKSSSFKMIGK